MDGSLFVPQAFQNPETATAADYTDFLNSDFGSFAPSIATQYSLSAFNSTPYPPFYAVQQILTDYSFKCPARRALNRATQNGVPGWAYEFNRTLSCPWFPFISKQQLQTLGATHTAELPFVFGNLNNLPLPNGTCNLTAQDHSISEDLIYAWTSMAANGNPALPESLQWPGYNPSTSFGLIIGETVTTGPIDYSICPFWDKIYTAQLQNATMTSPATRNTSGTADPSTGSGTLGGPSATPSTFTGDSTSVRSSSTLWLAIGLAVLIVPYV